MWQEVSLALVIIRARHLMLLSYYDSSKYAIKLKIAIGGIVSVIVMFMVLVGAISQSEADNMNNFLLSAIPLLLTSAPVVIGWIATTYTNARRDVKTSANVASK